MLMYKSTVARDSDRSSLVFALYRSSSRCRQEVCSCGVRFAHRTTASAVFVHHGDGGRV